MALFDYKKGPGLPPLIRELAQELAAALNGYPGSFDIANEFRFIMNAGNLIVIRVQNYPAGQWTPPPNPPFDEERDGPLNPWSPPPV